MAQLLITVIVIATFAILVGGGVNYIDRPGMHDAATATAIGAEHTRLASGIAGYRSATGALPPMANWQEVIQPYAPEQVRALPDTVRWVYIIRDDGFALCVDHPQAGQRSRARLAAIDCSTLPERLASGLVLMRPASTRLFDDAPRPAPTDGAPVIDLLKVRHSVMNVSDGPLEISSMAFPTGTAFRLEANDCLEVVLAPQAQCGFSVVFSAAGNGSFAADLQIEARPAGETG